MADVQEIITARVREAMAAAFDAEVAERDPLVGPARNPQFGDYQSNVAMSLAKALGRKPREIAEAIVESLDVSDLCEPVDIAGPGFINFKLTAAALGNLTARLGADDRLGVPTTERARKVVVDYSGPNVAKEMHVGHLRSSVIGDAIVRVLDFEGHEVIRQNHLGDWGTQFGMLIERMLDEGAEADAGAFKVGDLNALYQRAKQSFDADESFRQRARERVVKLQAHEAATLKLWRQLLEESYRHFSQAYERLNVLLRPEDVRGESAYNDMLPAVVAELEAAGIAQQSEGAVCVFVPDYESPMIIRKGDGGYGYDTTDLAALRYRVRELGAERLIYVTDSRQHEHFAKVFHAAERAGWLEGVSAEHVTFGTVLGEDGRPLKTRSGENVKLADLLDQAAQQAEAIVAEKNPELSEADRQRVAEVVGIGGIKYADLANDRRKDYVFSWQRMLATDGNTAPYLQYAYARIRSIFRKVGVAGPPNRDGAALRPQTVEERALLVHLARLPEVLRQVESSLEPHRLCQYLFDLATQFSAFYENCPVAGAADEAARDRRLVICDLTARGLALGLGLLGIEALDRM